MLFEHDDDVALRHVEHTASQMKGALAGAAQMLDRPTPGNADASSDAPDAVPSRMTSRSAAPS